MPIQLYAFKITLRKCALTWSKKIVQLSIPMRKKNRFHFVVIEFFDEIEISCRLREDRFWCATVFAPLEISF